MDECSKVDPTHPVSGEVGDVLTGDHLLNPLQESSLSRRDNAAKVRQVYIP